MIKVYYAERRGDQMQVAIAYDYREARELKQFYLERGLPSWLVFPKDDGRVPVSLRSPRTKP